MSNQYPIDGINQAYAKQIALINDPNREYHKLASSYAIDTVETFRQLFPGVQIKRVILREKSKKSILDKIRSLQIERFSKLAVIEADIPDILHKAEIAKFGSVQPINLEELESLFFDRIDENITPKDNTDDSIDYARRISDRYKDSISEVLKISISSFAEAERMFALVEGIFNETKISKNTKTALARIMYAKIKQGTLPEEYKKRSLQTLSEKYGSDAKEYAIKHATADTLKQAQDVDYLDLAKIKAIEQEEYDLSNPLYNNTYTSKLDQLLDEQWFIQAKDLQGMSIIIGSVPRDFKTHNKTLQELIKKRNNEQDAIELFNKTYMELSAFQKIYIGYLNSKQSKKRDLPNNERKSQLSEEDKTWITDVLKSLHSQKKLSDFDFASACNELKQGLEFESGDITSFPSYTKLDHECMAEISKSFSQYMERQSAQWLNQHDNSLLVRDSFKHKDKVNGYIADHYKIAMKGDLDKLFEVHVLSIYVDAKCKTGKTASHAARIGKQRIIPTVLESEGLPAVFQNKETLRAYMNNIPKENNKLYSFMDELDYLLPRYTRLDEDPKTHKFVAKDFNTSENAETFYDGVIMKEFATLEVIKNLIKAAESYGITIITSPKNLKSNIDTSVDSDSQSPLAASTRVDHGAPDF